MEAFQQDQTHNNLPHPLAQDHATSLQDPDFFVFLKITEEKHSRYPSFFSENGLGQDIIQVTQAEPDICLEVFYALYNTLWPQIETQSDVSFKDAWRNFIGGSIIKGSLCPPEKLIIERRVKDIKRTMSGPGENEIFHDLDRVVNSIIELKQKINDYPGEILYKEEIIKSLSLVQQFYLSHRNKVKGLIQAILEKEKINAPSTPESDELEDLLEPKAIMMSDIFAHHWAYRISRSQAQRLLSLNASGRNLKSNIKDPSNHRVIALPKNSDKPLVFFKANGHPPIQPEKEFMLYSLYKHLQIPVPETALLILTNVFLEDPEYFYAVQASEAVVGESALKASHDPETTFDHEAYVSQTIGAFLTNPSDGSFKNFKYSPVYKSLISIDNDLIFKPELIGQGDKFVNVKSILYLLPHIDFPTPESIKTFFTTVDPHLMILTWLQDLSQKNKEYSLLFQKLAFQKTRSIYQNLLPHSPLPPLAITLRQKVLVDHEFQNVPFYPQILVSQNLLMSIIEKLQQIEKILRNNCSVTTQILFEEISPPLGKYYRKLRFQFRDPEEALEASWGHQKNGVDYSHISSLLENEDLKSLSSSSNEFSGNFPPDTFFREYKDLLTIKFSPLDEFIRRHSQRKEKNLLNLQVARKELQFLVQEGLTSSQSPREIIDFCHILSKMDDSISSLTQEITSLLSNLSHPELKWLLTLERHFLRPDNSIPNDLMPSSISILGALMKQRTFILTESENQYLFDQEGNIKKNVSLTGRSSVTCFPEENPEFYLKQLPEWPGYEIASTLFMRLLGIQHLPYHDLLIANSKYPVLLTEKVIGNPVLRVWEKSETFHNLDPVHTGLLIISAMLLNPEDGKEDNFILSSDRKYLIPIDNDHCFLPSFSQKEGSFWNFWTVNTTLQTKTLLFCLDEMCRPIPTEVCKHILSVEFDSILTLWMVELDKIENKLKSLVDQNPQNNFLEQGTVIKISFYKQFIHNIHWKAHKIQDLLKTASTLTPFDLLKAVEPFAAKCYQNSFKQGDGLQTRFKAATNQLYKKAGIDGCRVSILNTRTMMEIINISERSLQTHMMFQTMEPADALELLNQLIREHKEKTTMEQDMLCELDETKHKNKWLSLFGNPLVETAFKEFFANPKEGLVLKGSKLITSGKLTELFTEAPNSGMRIRFLSLPESPSLTEKEIRILAEECSNIEYLNVNSCTKLKEISTREGEWPLLIRLEAKGCLNLKRFVSSSPMKILRVETDQEIEIFVEKHSLEIFTISKRKLGFEFSFKKGENLEIKSQGQILSNDDFLIHVMRGKEEVKKYLSDFKIMMEINSILSKNELRVFITFLDFRKLNFKTDDDIERIVLLHLINLKKLGLSRTCVGTKGLGYLIQGNWQNLNNLDLSHNPIRDEGVATLSQGNWPFLETLNLGDTQMTAVGVEIMRNQASWSQLKDLDLSSNEIYDEGIETLAHRNWPLLETLNLHRTGMTVVGVRTLVFHAKLSQLKLLDISKNPIHDEGFEALSQGNWPLIETLDLHETNSHERVIENLPFFEIFNGLQITQKRFLHFIFNKIWPNLKKVYLDSLRTNGRTNLFQKDRHLVESLDLTSCNISPNEIKVIGSKCSWSQLKDLDLSENEVCDEGLEILASSNWNLLEYLNLEKTGITGKGIEILINRSLWPNLKELDISQNSLQDKGIITLSSGKWPRLERLYLINTEITEEGIQSMISRSFWPNLKILGLSYVWASPQQSRGRALEHLNLIQTRTHVTYLDRKNQPGSSIQNLASRKWSSIRVTTSDDPKKKYSKRFDLFNPFNPFLFVPKDLSEAPEGVL